MNEHSCQYDPTNGIDVCDYCDLITVPPVVLINDTRTIKQKLADLTNENLLSDMEHSFENFKRDTDPYGVMSYKWLWSRWIRSN